MNASWLAACLGLFAIGLIWFLIEKSRRRTHPVVGGIDRGKTLTHTQDVELYSNAFSHCSRKSRFVLAELGIEAKHHAIDLIETGGYQTLSPDYLRVNPAGLVPTLVHKGHPVFESDDILTYAQTIAPLNAPKLVPTQRDQQEAMQEWLSFCAIVSADLFGGMKDRAGACIPGLTMPLFATSIRYIPLRKILIGFLFHPSMKSPALFTAFKVLGFRRMMVMRHLRKLVHTSRDHMRVHLDTLDHALANHGQPWILGEAFSLADVTIACLLLRLEETTWLDWYMQSGTLPHVTEYYRRLQARPAWSEAIVAHAHPIIEQAKRDLSKAVSSDPSFAVLLYGPAANALEKRATLSW
ncbi:MAG: glutathione S-transferase family protein [Pseudomonadota bacterium]